MTAQVIGIDALDSMSASFEQTKAFIFKISSFHRALPHAQKSNFMIQFDFELDVPSLPDLARALREFGVFLVCAVGGANNLADIRGSGEGMRQRPRINQNDVVP